VRNHATHRPHARNHTITRFRAAAGARYGEARRLETEGYRLGAIYLFGYSAEMLLKAAYFRVRGFAANATITLQHLVDARQQARSAGLVWTGNLHDLSGWARLLTHERETRGSPYTSRYGNQLLSQVNSISQHWREWLRYHDMTPYAGEVVTVRSAATWLFTQYPHM